MGACFIALAAFVAYESASSLIRQEVPERSIPCIAIAALSLIAMPILARAKRNVATAIGSGAMTSGITLKPAIKDHFKTGQRN